MPLPSRAVLPSPIVASKVAPKRSKVAAMTAAKRTRGAPRSSKKVPRVDAAAKKSNNAPRLPAKVLQKSTVDAACRQLRFACGDAVEVCNRLFSNVVFSGNRQLVIYLRAKVLSVSVGTESYLVEYPAINSKPSRVARVPSWDVREPRHAPPQAHPAADAARPASSKRPPPPERTDRGDDCCKKAKRVGKGIPMDALCRFYEEHDPEFASELRRRMIAKRICGTGGRSTRSSSDHHFSGSASYQVVPYKNVHGENNLPVLSKKIKFIISTYSVQCSICQKWRVVPSKLKYEQIRENIIQVPFSCKYVHGWKPQVTCHDPIDISEDNGMAWAIDIPCIPQIPLGWERNITLRNEQSTRFADVYYISPAGIKIRSKKEVGRYLEDNPNYAVDLHLSQFSFKVPKPPNCPRQSKLIEPTEVPPPVHEDPVHNYMPVPHGEANPVTHIPVTLALQVSVMLSKKRKLNQ
ncbi:uncharacterized protein [Triticum aestivum]|nr:uncharacterized protein LOC123153277 [Triticum aestivum]